MVSFLLKFIWPSFPENILTFQENYCYEEHKLGISTLMDPEYQRVVMTVVVDQKNRESENPPTPTPFCLLCPLIPNSD